MEDALNPSHEAPSQALTQHDVDLGRLVPDDQREQLDQLDQIVSAFLVRVNPTVICWPGGRGLSCRRRRRGPKVRQERGRITPPRGASSGAGGRPDLARRRTKAR
jgi:hypothetical protein